ncbi:EAL domain-containing protein [Stigmatella aurantiaca]|uniref:Diguanylate phosphodiesterase n=1 Tax=Stigmatella aurantiaca (strain DW4/3-1) TaxID=378806 RepID=Q08UR4_STIAD|nr:EAL domain-containing protein [Stigmatella aurantiaca]ADO70818.1 Diguanylate phosphodiesterase (EAL domain) [Stigmatella aurantiaca DW4/3-1]EAU64220.1 diguanylate phosphodiesterase [Stigmatella aurantiaca DW4/3-1]
MSDPLLAQCGRCQTLPSKVEQTGQLFLWPPLGHSLGKLVAFMRGSGLEHQLRPEAQCVVVQLEEGAAGALALRLADVLTREEIRGTRALFKQGTGEPDLTDFPKVGPLQQFLSLSRAGWLVDMLAEQRVTSHFQPIVHANDTRRIFAHEALMRGVEQDGSFVPPSKMMETARGADMLFQLDLAARAAAIREAVRHGLDGALFINFTPTAIYDPAYCLRSTVSVIKDAGLEPRKVVFEVIESDHAQDTRHLRAIIDFYRKAGFLVALDDLGAGHSSLNLIHQLRPDIMKLDMELIRNIHEDEYKASITQKLLEIAQKLNILTVAEGIETLEELRWVRAHGVDYLQGYLIARPQNPPVQSTPHFTG